jgi:hypothetical protein
VLIRLQCRKGLLLFCCCFFSILVHSNAQRCRRGIVTKQATEPLFKPIRMFYRVKKGW